jgi:protein SHQ1
LPQTLSSEPLHTSLAKPYGFLNQHSGYFRHAGSSSNEANELGGDAETISPVERRRRRITCEDAKFDPEHYAADLADDEYIKELIHWTHPYTTPCSEAFEYTEAEKLTMLRLPRKEYLFTPSDGRALHLTLISFLFGYAYDARTTQMDPTPESAWTICCLVPAFAALDPPPYSSGNASLREDVDSVFVASYRRALAYPLFRSWALCDTVRVDVGALLGAGKRTVLRCLLDLKRVLDGNDAYYVYTKIWVDDMLVWAMAHIR